MCMLKKWPTALFCRAIKPSEQLCCEAKQGLHKPQVALSSPNLKALCRQ